MKSIDVGLAVFLLATGLSLVGCEQSASTVDTADSENGQRHQHGSGHAHADPHNHGHQHGDPIHGGRIVAIGHTHHGSKETHYHAEIMPVVSGQITFHVLTDDAKGKSQTVPVAATKIVAYVDPLDRETVQAYEVVFSSKDNGGGSTFVATIPESLQDCKRLSVVVPKIELGGERLNFSFTTSLKDAPAQSQETTEETST